MRLTPQSMASIPLAILPNQVYPPPQDLKMPPILVPSHRKEMVQLIAFIVRLLRLIPEIHINSSPSFIFVPMRLFGRNLHPTLTLTLTSVSTDSWLWTDVSTTPDSGAELFYLDVRCGCRVQSCYWWKFDVQHVLDVSQNFLVRLWRVGIKYHLL